MNSFMLSRVFLICVYVLFCLFTFSTYGPKQWNCQGVKAAG